MFLEIKSIEKYYGTGENRTKVLKGITTGVEKGKIIDYGKYRYELARKEKEAKKNAENIIPS